jgi:hypothetical protein
LYRFSELVRIDSKALSLRGLSSQSFCHITQYQRTKGNVGVHDKSRILTCDHKQQPGRPFWYMFKVKQRRLRKYAVEESGLREAALN